MTGEERRLVVEGFTFELTGFFSAEGVTTVTVSVNGTGESTHDLKGWVMEVCPGDARYFEDEGVSSAAKSGGVTARGCRPGQKTNMS